MVLRVRIDARRAVHAWGSYPWTDHPIVAGATFVKSARLTALKTARNQVYSTVGATPLLPHGVGGADPDDSHFRIATASERDCQPVVTLRYP